MRFTFFMARFISQTRPSLVSPIAWPTSASDWPSRYRRAGLLFVLGKLRDGPHQAFRFFVADDVLTGCRLSRGVNVAIGQSLFAGDVAIPRMQLVADGIADIPFVNLPQPGGKLRHVFPLEFGNLFVHRQARLLHHVGSVDAGGRPVVERILRQEPQVPTIVLQQLSRAA